MVPRGCREQAEARALPRALAGGPQVGALLLGARASAGLFLHVKEETRAQKTELRAPSHRG